MNTTHEGGTNRCPGCGQPRVEGRAQGLCPRCLLVRAAMATEAGGQPGASEVPDLATISAAFPQLEGVEFVGRGGMGIVYKARQRSLGRWVALKLLAPERVTDPEFAGRFEREARALAQLSHPNIVTIHDFGMAGGGKREDGAAVPPFYYLLMEYVDGVNLRQAMAAGRFTPEQALAIVPPVCEALQYAHERGIVHRDIKPENLLLDRDGRVKIADFGIARMLGGAGDAGEGAVPGREAGAGGSATQHTAAGTPQYMAPEQRDPGARADHRADIYSLGVVLYELLTGELPGARLDPPSAKVQVDVRLDAVVLRALSVRPELRYATAAEFRTELGTAVRAQGEEAASPGAAGAVPLKVSGGFLYRLEEMETLEGQFCAWRRKGQIVLDGSRLLHVRDGRQTLIPLSTIREVSVGDLAQSWNPGQLDVLHLVCEGTAGTDRWVLVPVDGWFSRPSTVNARVEEWAVALRGAVVRATGRPPLETPRAALPVAGSRSKWAWLLPLLVAVPGMVLFAALAFGRNSPRPETLGLFVLMLIAIPLGSYVGTRMVFSRGGHRVPGSRSPWIRETGMLLLVLGMVMGVSGRSLETRTSRAEVAAYQGSLLAVMGEEGSIDDRLRRLESSRAAGKTTRPYTLERSILEASRQVMKMQRAGLERVLARPPKPSWWAVWLPGLPLLVAGAWLVFGRRPVGRSMTAFVVVGAVGAGVGVLWWVYGPTGDGRPGPAPAVMGRIEPLRVEGLAVVLEVQTAVAVGPAELRVAFDGPAPDSREMAAIERKRFGGLREGLPANGVWPGIPAGNQPWHLEPVGSNLWEVAFLFPSAAAAKETFRGLGPREFGPIGLGDDDAVELFDTIASDGRRYRARLSAGRPVTRARPGHASVLGRATFEEGTIRVGWDLSASGACEVSTKVGGDEASKVLPRVPYRLQGADLEVALTLLAPDRFRLEMQLLGTRSTEEIEGDADEAAKELLGSMLMTGQGRFGDEFELCRVGGRSVRLKVARAGK